MNNNFENQQHNFFEQLKDERTKWKKAENPISTSPVCLKARWSFVFYILSV